MSWILVSDSSDILNASCEGLPVNPVSYQKNITDEDIHDWVCSEIKNCDGVLMPLTLNIDPRIPNYNIEGLLYAMHIRLNYEDKETSRLPIILLSNMSLENIIRYSTFDDSNNLQNLLFTKNISVVPFENEIIQRKMNEMTSLTDFEYSSCLNKLNVNKKANVGNHDISNAWGCYRLANILGDDILKQVKENKHIKKHLKQLYSKYLICKNNITFENEPYSCTPIPCKGRKILFIDDKSDEGWATIMQYIFQEAGDGFEYIDASKYKTQNFDKDGFINECVEKANKFWDLIILDLRLIPEDENSINNNPEDLSGNTILRWFLHQNAGYQILISTASNKAWNITYALKNGAKGFYIKESPNFPEDTVTQYNRFRNQVEECFKKSFLYNIYKDQIEFKNRVEKCDYLTKEESDNISKQLDIAFNLISNAKNEEEYAYSYISLFSILELLCQYLIEEDSGIFKMPNDKHVEKIIYEKNTGEYINKGIYHKEKQKEIPDHLSVLASLCKKMWYEDDKLPNNYQKTLWSVIHIRNTFIHDTAKAKEEPACKIIYEGRGYKELFNVIFNIVNLKYIS